MRTTLTSVTLALALLMSGAGWVHAQGVSADNDKSGTTGAMTTTPHDASDDAVGTRGTMMNPSATAAGDATTTTGGTTAGAANTGMSSWFANRNSGEIVGKTLYGANGEEIGEINNVVMAQGGNKPEALVGVGGFLGIGEREITIPLDQLQMQGDRLTTSMTKEQIGERQPYDQGSYQEWDRNRPLGSGS